MRKQQNISYSGNEKGLGGAGIFPVMKWVDKVIDANRVKNKMIFIRGCSSKGGWAKDSKGLCRYEYGNREYTLQDEGK